MAHSAREAHRPMMTHTLSAVDAVGFISQERTSDLTLSGAIAMSTDEVMPSSG